MRPLSNYNVVATEYYDQEAHPTCFNFNRLSRIYLEKTFPEPWKEAAIVEVGAGDSAAASLLHARGYSVSGLLITDAFERMLTHSSQWQERGAKLEIMSAQDLKCETASFDMLISSLGDPYNTPSFWSEAFRVLRPGGRVIFTTPSFEWANRFRTEAAANRAEFIIRNGTSVDLPSFVMPLPQQIAMIASAGFTVTNFSSLGEELLHPAERLSPKLAVFERGRSSIIWGFELSK